MIIDVRFKALKNECVMNNMLVLPHNTVPTFTFCRMYCTIVVNSDSRESSVVVVCW